MTYSQLLEGQLVLSIFFNEGVGGTNIFSYFNEICFSFKKRILYGNEWDNDKSKQIIKISNQNIFPGPNIPS